MNVKTLVVFQENAIPYFAIKERHVARFRVTYPDAAVVWCRDEASFLAVLPRADVAVTWEFRQAWFDHAPCLRRIATPAAAMIFSRLPRRPPFRSDTGPSTGPSWRRPFWE